MFTDLYLRDLEARLPRADVHRFVGANHLVAEDADVAGAALAWIARPDRETAPSRARAPATARPRGPDSTAGRADAAVAMVEMTDAGPGRSITFAALDADVRRVAAGLVAQGVEPGDRVALLVPPGIDLTVCLYACWRMGAVVVLVDAGLGPRGIGRALKSADPRYLVGIPRALAAARVLGWPGRRISAVEMSRAAATAAGVWTTLDAIRTAGAGRPAPPTPADSDPAAVVFTSGATGPAKGVAYRHHQLQAQRDVLAGLYGITEDDRFVAAFAPFALYGPAMGVPSVVPAMEITAPGTLRAAALADAAAAIDATLVFASPAALVNVIATADALEPRHRAALARIRRAPLGRRAGQPVGARRGRGGRAERRGAHALRHDRGAARHRRHAGRDRRRRAGERCLRRPSDRGRRVAIDALDDAGRPTGTPTDRPDVVGEVCIRAAHASDGYDKLWLTQHRADAAARLAPQRRRRPLRRRRPALDRGPADPRRHHRDRSGDPGRHRAGGRGARRRPPGRRGRRRTCGHAAGRGRPRPRRRAAPSGPRAAARSRAAVRAALDVDVAAVLVVPHLPVDKRHNSKIDRTRVGTWASGVLAGGRMRRL